MTTLEEMLVKRPVNRARVDKHKAAMNTAVQVYALRELRETLNITQTALASALDVTQARVSAIERGDFERASVDTLRRYVEALGGHLRVEVELGDDRIEIG